FWDTAGQERYRTLQNVYYRGANACVLVYSIDNRESFNALDSWFSHFVSETGRQQTRPQKRKGRLACRGRGVVSTSEQYPILR
ncbi:ras-domain-containing protein, partial [Aphelenchoides avenae]